MAPHCDHEWEPTPLERARYHCRRCGWRGIKRLSVGKITALKAPWRPKPADSLRHGVVLSDALCEVLGILPGGGYMVDVRVWRKDDRAEQGYGQ